MKHLRPNDEIDLQIADYAVFLGGSIDMNTAERWQDYIVEQLSGYSDNLVLLNPRRDDWDSSWVQDPTPGTPFYNQVMWERSAQESADLIVYNFSVDSKAPITLLELGEYGSMAADYVVVCCPKGFWRYGNVAIFCEQHDILLVHTIEELLEEIKDRLIV